MRAAAISWVALLAVALAACPDAGPGPGATNVDAASDVPTQTDGTPDTAEPDTADTSDTGDANVPLQCNPGVTQNYCPTATSVIECDGDGKLWREVECKAGQFCFSGVCSDIACPPGAITCADTKTVSACLVDGAGGYGWTDITTCPGACQGGTCIDVCGFDPKPNISENCEHFQLELEGTPDNACSQFDLLAVPSSATNQIAVFDISTATPTPLAGSPFETCEDPSRILVDRHQRIIATCRGDGGVSKHASDGTVEWSIQLPECSAVRGAVIGPDDRLFVGCSSSRNVHELNPDDGSVIDTLQTGIGVYGMAVDGTGIYVTDFGNLMKISVVAGLSAVWKVSANGYGIATDGIGGIWLTEAPGMVRYSAADGSVTTSVAIDAPEPWFGAYCNGITVSLEGKVFAGCAEGGNFVATYEPETETSDVLILPDPDEHPRGVAVDRNGNLYTINLNSSSVTRFDGVTSETASFGQGLLSGPYGYSGDMTGLTSCLFAGSTTWLSEVMDQGDPDTKWLKVDWTETVPTGTSLTVHYRLDEGPWVQILAGMEIGATAQTLQIRVVLESTVDDLAPTLHELAVYYE